MGALQDHMIRFMRTRGYSEKTISAYTSCVKSLAYTYNRSPLKLSKPEVEAFFYGLREKDKSDSTVHVHYEAVKFFYKIHGVTDMLPQIKFARKTDRLPVVLSKSEVAILLNSFSSLKYRTIFFLIYSAGLRVSEAANLKLTDIDFQRKTIFVRQGKNSKDRYTVLGAKAAQLLRDYISMARPKEHLFYSRSPEQKLSVDAIQRSFRETFKMTEIPKAAHVHTLRHSFATHLLEDGTNIFYIMDLLGHQHIETTMVYLHIQSLESRKILSPIDTLPPPARNRNIYQIDMFCENVS